MIKNLFELSILVFLTQSTALAVEGDIIQDRTGCYLEQAKGIEVPITCPHIVTQRMDQKSLNESVNLLREFDESSISSIVKQASKEQSTDTGSRQFFSKDVLKKAAKIRNDKYLVKITFINESNYPNKSNLGHGYHVADNGTFQVLDSVAEAQWDEIISADLIGNDFEKYQAHVDAITSKNVIITVQLNNSDQLESLIKGKNIKSIDHAGLPDVIYDEISR